MLIRRELAADVDRVAEIIGAAFANPDTPDEIPVEVTLVEALRKSAEWIPEVSLVAEDNQGLVIGQVICTRGWVDEVPVLALGPIAVAPDTQRRGVGKALMHAVLGAADELGEPIVALLGHLDYYPQFGFRPGSELGILPPDPSWGDHFQVRTLSSYRPELHGTFRYATPFNEM